jgi:hypothetical protein
LDLGGDWPVQGDVVEVTIEEAARRKGKAYNSSYEQELFLARGGTLAQWYAQAAPPPPETPESVAQRQRERILAQMPDGLNDDELRTWCAHLSKSSGVPIDGKPAPDSAEAVAIRKEFAAFWDRTREEFGL